MKLKGKGRLVDGDGGWTGREIRDDIGTIGESGDGGCVAIVIENNDCHIAETWLTIVLYTIAIGIFEDYTGE